MMFGRALCVRNTLLLSGTISRQLSLGINLQPKKYSILSSDRTTANLPRSQSELLSAPCNNVYLHSKDSVRYLSTKLPAESPKQPKTAGTRMWTRLATTVKAFVAGTKLLYKDVKLMYELNSRKGKLVIRPDFPKGELDCNFTREEVQFLYKTKNDLWKMLPAIVVFFIPVIGYLVPIIVFMYPQRMLSQHFWNEEQKTAFAATSEEISQKDFKALLGLMNATQLDALSLIGKQLAGLDGSQLPTTFAIKNLSKEWTDLLYGGWRVKSWGFYPYQRLLNHMCYLHLSDWMILQEGGVDQLTEEEVFEACRERRLTVVDDDMNPEDWKKLLQSWINLSTQFKECPLSLLAHVPVALFQNSSSKTELTET